MARAGRRQHRFAVSLQSVAVLPEIRELRYFVAVAEERRFTHAAQRLYITQQSVSAAIAQLERRLGVELLVRDRQGLRLTPAGDALLGAARGILAQAATAVQDTRRAAGAAPLRVGYAVLAASELTTPILAHLQAAEPQLEIRLRLADYDDPSAGLATATADVALVRRPIDGPYAFEDLFAEARVAVLARTHARAAAESVWIDELAADPVITDPGPDAVWRAFYTADDVRGGPPARGVEVGSFDEELATVALGRAIAFTSAAAARLYPRPDVGYVPLADAAPCTVALAWHPERPPTVLASLLSAARRARAQARADGSFERYGWR
jgi:DNA-binding transcriptional LysR family regulator